jgi:hypothetical protein
MIDQHGQLHSILYTTNVKARCDYEWETIDHPTGWNYKSDQPTYTSYEVPTANDILIQSVSFNADSEFNIDNQDLPIQEAINKFGKDIVKELLNPDIIRKAMAPGFKREIDSLEPYYEEPEDRRDYDYDR